MRSETQQSLGFWGSRWTFALALAGLVVGLGNIWRLPAAMGEHGGAAFLLVYCLALLVIGVPVLMAELMLGRTSRRGPVSALRLMTRGTSLEKPGPWVGRSMLITVVLLLGFYGVVGGMALAYIFRAALGELPGDSSQAAFLVFESFRASPLDLMIWQVMFLLLLFIVTFKGLQRGLQRSLRMVMPITLLLLGILLIVATSMGDTGQAGRYLLSFRWEELGWDGGLSALVHAFYTLTIGMGAVLILGAYMPVHGSMRVSALGVALVDTLIALLAGVLVFALVFGQQLVPAQGFELLFVTLPQGFDALPGGQVVGSLFYVLVAVVAWSSALLMMEAIIGWLSEKWDYRRQLAVIVVTVLVWMSGVFVAFSFSHWSELFILGQNAFEWINTLTSVFLIPAIVLFVAILCGWVLPVASLVRGLEFSGWGLLLWRYCLRYLVPLAVLIVFIQGMHQYATLSCERASLIWCEQSESELNIAPVSDEPLGTEVSP